MLNCIRCTNISHSFYFIIITLYLIIYVTAGLYTEKRFTAVKPIPEKVLDDFKYYEQAISSVKAGKDPYQPRHIGMGYLYPPQALLILEVFAYVKNFTARAVFFISVNIAMLIYMVRSLAKYFGYSYKKVWYWYVLCLGFAPFLTVLHTGEINVVTLFGIFLLFVFEKKFPIISGCGLSLAIVTKVTPLILLPYLIVRKKYKVLITTLCALSVLTIVSVMRYGISPFLDYPSVFHWLTQQFPLGANSQSLVAKLIVADPQVLRKSLLLFPHPQVLEVFSSLALQKEIIQRILTSYVLIVVLLSGLFVFFSKSDKPREPMLIVSTLAMMLAPNVMWYHHYVFILIPLLVWMGWSRLNGWVVSWSLLGFLIIQIDRWFPPYGLLIHIFGHVSLLYMLTFQAKQYFREKTNCKCDDSIITSAV